MLRQFIMPVSLYLLLYASIKIVRGCHTLSYGRWYRDGNPLPGRLTSRGHSEIDVAYGHRLVRWGRKLLACGGVSLVAGATGIAIEDTTRIGPVVMSVLHSSGTPLVDVQRGVILMVIFMMTFMFTQAEARMRRPEGPWQGLWRTDGVQSRPVGFALIAAGTAVSLSVAGILFFLLYRINTGLLGGLTTLLGPWFFFLAGPLYKGGLDLRRRGRRHLTRVLASPDQVDDPFVLYLRSFVHDAELDVAKMQYAEATLVQMWKTGRSEEEHLARVVRRLGKLVAVGKPGERLPYVGADRVYLPPGDWRGPVRELIRRARLVVLTIGPGEGTMWELVECYRVLTPDRLVLLVPFGYLEYEQFRERAERQPTPALPAWSPAPGASVTESLSQLRAVIRYTEAAGQWKPELVWLASETRPIRRATGLRDYAYVGLKHALAPTVSRLAAPRKPRAG